MKTGHVEKTNDRDFETELRRYRTMEAAANKLQKEAKGYLERRTRSDNHRVHDLSLTEHGLATLADADATWIGIVEEKQAGWTEQEKMDFLRLLEKYNGCG